MILLVLLLIIVGLTAIVCSLWKGLGILERWTKRWGFTKSSPVFGMLSVIAIILGFLGLILGVRVDTDIGVFIALMSWIFGAVLGISFAVASFARPERAPAVGFLALLSSIVFVMWRWGL